MRLSLEEKFAREKRTENSALKRHAKDPYSLNPHHTSKTKKGPNPESIKGRNAFLLGGYLDPIGEACQEEIMIF
jgi:hypothetical protein